MKSEIGKMNVFFLSLFIFSFTTLAWAQSTLEAQLRSKKLPRFSGNLSSSFNSNLYPADSYTYRSSLYSDAIVNYRLKDAHLLRSYVGGVKEFTQGEEWKPVDGFVAWVNNRFWFQKKKFTLGQQVRLGVPLTRESRERDSKISSLGVIPVLIMNLAPRMTLIYQPSVTRNFHTFKQNRLGANNVEYSAGNLLIGIFSITDKIYYQAVTGYGQSWSYQGTPRDPNFNFSNELGLGLTKQLTIAAGWSNAGRIRLLEQGEDQSFEFFNNRTSTVYSSLYWLF